jgi:hypothetical protein
MLLVICGYVLLFDGFSLAALFEILDRQEWRLAPPAARRAGTKNKLTTALIFQGRYKKILVKLFSIRQVLRAST